MTNANRSSEIEMLYQKLRDSERRVRIEAGYKLLALEKPSISWLIDELKDEDWHIRSSAAVLLANIGNTQSVIPLISALNDENDEVRWDVVNALGRSKARNAVPALIEILRNDKVDYVRWSAATALGEIGDQRAVEPLINALADESKGVQTKTAEALGKTKDKRAVKPLIPLLKDDDCGLRQMVGLSLGLLDDRRAIGPLINSLQDENNHVRFYVFQALGNLGDSSIFSILKQAYDREPDEAVKNMANRAISYIEKP
jgi:HEAT repeat protein